MEGACGGTHAAVGRQCLAREELEAVLSRCVGTYPGRKTRLWKTKAPHWYGSSGTLILILVYIRQVLRSAFLGSSPASFFQAKNLYSSLEEYLKGYDVEVTMGKGYVEVGRGVRKGEG